MAALLEIESVRDIRLASKALMGLPQHWLSPDVTAGMERLAATARARGVSLAVHTHVNAAQSVTPLVARAARALLDAGVRDVRNQGVLLRGVNDSANALLDLCFALLDGAGITPYYFYLCDMIPGAEHWRLTVGEAQALQSAIMGYLPGFATPRVVCDVPYVGKRWVHQVTRYDDRARHLVLDEGLPDRDRGRRPGGARPGVPLLRPGSPAARGRPGVVARPRRPGLLAAARQLNPRRTGLRWPPRRAGDSTSPTASTSSDIS